MKLIKNIILIAVMIIVLYIVGLFIMPETVAGFGNKIGLEKFNRYIVDFKKGVDETAIKDFKVEQLQKTYEETLSGAKNKIDEVKNTIDNIRGGINSTRETIEKTAETVKQAKKEFENIRDTVIGSEKNLTEAQKKYIELKKQMLQENNINNQ